MGLFQQNSTEIWFTIGPVSDNTAVITKLLESGASGARLSFSYGTPDIQIQRAKVVKELAKSTGHQCKVIADLAGEKVRLGDFGSVNHINVAEGEEIKLVADEKFDSKEMKIPVTSKDFISRSEKGDIIFVGDGSAILEVSDKRDGMLICKALNDGIMNSYRGIVAQSGTFQPRSLTDKDISDLEQIARSKLFDAVALSFVSDSSDISIARRILNENNSSIPVIAKIETRAGLANIKSILKSADAVMIARGDLAMFLPWAELGNIVDIIVNISKDMGKPWIMATHIAEGLERFVFPTRAEICDISRWVKEGVSAFVLSYETAFGSRPVDSVSCVRQIIDATIRIKGGNSPRK